MQQNNFNQFNQGGGTPPMPPMGGRPPMGGQQRPPMPLMPQMGGQQRPPMRPMPPTPPKKKSRKWLWILLAIFVGFPVLSLIIAPPDGKKSTTPTSDKEAVNKTATDTVESLKDLEKAKKLSVKFTEKKDEFKGITWITPKSKPRYINNTGIYSYFSLRDSVPENMRFVIQYGSDDWLFINSYTFLIDGKTFEFSNPDVERDHDSEIWEWSDTQVFRDRELAIIYAHLIDAKEAKIRFNGDKYHSDYTIPQSALQSLRDTREYYFALGGK